ncbi:MAG: ribosomal protein S5, nonfunctional [Candidatus Saccharibacteria bacterium GW2011_GWA2_46_10]|nr:MAG: ribosomal protein S5, nonfunctional [Candidatus Saccharibacteria bacterium GW2011_GWA2_46_10]OGL35541.1 MAG: 30S ribosomal protein S5 [Candidatus Saccharibacteria bacterium RIFCSPHIGHO2_12_FULL_47_17]
MVDKRVGPTTLPSDDKSFDERVLFVNRVARVVKGGRRFRFQALVVAGDHAGQVGMGVSKGADVMAAITKATNTAKKNLLKVPIRGGTLTHEVEAKVSGSNILLKPAAPGTGLIAGGVVRTVLEVAGYENVLSKSLGSNNKVNTAYATLLALTRMTTPDKWVTRKNQQPKTKPKKKVVK